MWFRMAKQALAEGAERREAAEAEEEARREEHRREEEARIAREEEEQHERDLVEVDDDCNDAVDDNAVPVDWCYDVDGHGLTATCAPGRTATTRTPRSTRALGGSAEVSTRTATACSTLAYAASSPSSTTHQPRRAGTTAEGLGRESANAHGCDASPHNGTVVLFTETQCGIPTGNGGFIAIWACPAPLPSS